jgi:hypothetical protein
MDVILLGLGIWCLVSIPSAFVVARFCALNKSRSEIVVPEQPHLIKPPTPLSKEHLGLV